MVISLKSKTLQHPFDMCFSDDLNDAILTLGGKWAFFSAGGVAMVYASVSVQHFLKCFLMLHAYIYIYYIVRGCAGRCLKLSLWMSRTKLGRCMCVSVHATRFFSRMKSRLSQPTMWSEPNSLGNCAHFLLGYAPVVI